MQHETRNIWSLGFGAAYIRDLTVSNIGFITVHVAHTNMIPIWPISEFPSQTCALLLLSLHSVCHVTIAHCNDSNGTDTRVRVQCNNSDMTDRKQSRVCNDSTVTNISHGEYRFPDKKFKHFSRTFSRTFFQILRTFPVSFQVYHNKEIQGNLIKSWISMSFTIKSQIT